MSKTQSIPVRPALLASGLVAVLLAGMFATTHAADNQTADSNEDRKVEEWISQLADGDWQQRDAASRKILEAGPQAVPLLRSNREHEDPEVCQRIEWLLSVLDPEVYQLQFIRLGPAPQSEPFLPLEIREWQQFRIRSGESATGPCQNLDGEGTRLTVAVHAAAKRVGLAVSFRSNQSSRNCTLSVGSLSALRNQELVEVETIAGRVRRSVIPSLWLVLLQDGSMSVQSLPPSADHRAKLQAQLEKVLHAQLQSDDMRLRKQAMRVASHWRRFDLLPTKLDPEDPARREWLCARLGNGDPQVRAELESHIAQPKGVGIEERDRAAILLTACGSSVGRGVVLERLPELSPWNQYKAVQALSRSLEGGTLPEEQVLAILRAVSDPDTFRYLPWASPEVPLLFQLLQDQLQPSHFREPLVSLLVSNLDLGTSGGALRVHTLLRALRNLPEDQRLSVAEWFPPVTALLESGRTQGAFTLVRDAYLEGKLTPEQWQKALAILEQNLRSSNYGLVRATDRMLGQLICTPQVSAQERKELWLERLALLESPTVSLRNNFDKKLVQDFGALPERRPGPREAPAWQARSEAWRERLVAMPDETFLMKGQQGPLLRVTWADFRVDRDRDESRLIGFETRDVEPGTAYPAQGPDGEDRTILVTRGDSTGRGRSQYTYAVGDTSVRLGIPTLMNTRSGNSFRSTLMTDATYGPQAPPRRRDIQFRRVLLLDEADQVPAAREWSELLARMVEEALNSKNLRRSSWLQIIEELRLRDAVPPFLESYRKNQEIAVAKTLMVLGETSGRDQLLAHMDSRNAREAVDILGTLIRIGDAKAVEQALAWLASPPPHVRGYHYNRILQALRWALQNSVLEADDAVIGAIVQSLDAPSVQSLATQMLRKYTGHDFGYTYTFQVQDPRERKEAQKQVIQEWQQWWGQRPAESSKH
ncbi:MAG: hypothetical protein V3T77_00245 [Planctomycetota bacterium]